MNILKNKKYGKGFSLIEMMIVVAILGILVSIAVPSYSAYVQKGKRTDGKVELLRIAQLQESYFAQNLSYAKILGASTATIGGLGFGATVMSEQQAYQMSIVATPGTCTGLAGANACTGFTLTAAPYGSQVNDTSCKGFTLNNVGQKNITVTGATADATRNCWR